MRTCGRSLPQSRRSYALPRANSKPTADAAAISSSGRSPRPLPSSGEPAGANRTTKLSQPEMVLVSMYRASGGRTERIPYEEIVVRAHRDFPEAFSLRNYPQFPDASDIHKKLYQALKPNGLVVTLGD